MEPTPDPIADPDAETAPLDRSSRRVTDFPWESLPSLSAAHVETGNRLLHLLPLGDGHRDTLPALADHLTEITDLPHTIDFHRLRIRDPSAPLPPFGDAFTTRFHMPPDPEIGALLLDRSLIDRWMHALRGDAPDIRVAGHIDHRAFGLATYLVVRLFDWLKAERGAPPVVFPTEPPLRETLRKRLEEADGLVEVTYAVSTDRNRHLARLLIPDGLVRNCELFHRSDAGRRAPAARLVDGTMADLELELPFAIGRTALDARTVENLAPRDVVLFDEHGYAPDTDSPAADPDACLHLADGGSTFLPGYAIPGATHWEFHPLDWTPRTDDQETDPVDETTDPPDDAAAETDGDPGPTDLLETPEIQLEARLGSTTLTVRQLGELQPGEILTLDARVGRPVDLVVDDRVIGKGELVEIEGKLGVRVRRIDR